MPFQSGHFKRLAADTLYDFTGCDTPTVTPNSYKRVVRYYDSCNHLNWHWQPELQAWAVSDGSGGAETWEDVLNNQGAIPFASTHNTDLGNNNFTLSKANIFTISSDDNVNPYSSFQIAPTYNNLISSGDTTEASALIQNNNTPATTNAQLQASNVASGKAHIVRANVDSILIQGSIAGVPSTDLRVRGLPYDGDTSSVKPIVIDANGRVYRSNWLGDGTIGIRDTAKIFQGYGLLIFNPDSTYGPNLGDVLFQVDTSRIATKNDITIITNTDTAVFIVDSISNSPPAGAVNGNDYLVGTSATGLFAGHENDIAELVGGVYTFTDPIAQQQLIVDNAVTYATYQFNGVAWVQTSILWRVNGNTAIGQNSFLGKISKAQMPFRSWNKVFMYGDTTRDVYLPKWIGTRSGNYVKFDSATGRLDTGFFRPLIEGANITITPGPVGDTLSATGGGSAGITADETQTATASQTAFTFTDVPADFEDYIMFVWGVAATPTTDYTTSGDVVTFTTGLTEGSLVRFKRIK